jgi:hypothetical protein
LTPSIQSWLKDEHLLEIHDLFYEVQKSFRKAMDESSFDQQTHFYLGASEMYQPSRKDVAQQISDFQFGE